MAERWSSEELAKVRSTPWDLRVADGPERVDLGEAVPRDAVVDDPALPTARRLKITKKVPEVARIATMTGRKSA